MTEMKEDRLLEYQLLLQGCEIKHIHNGSDAYMKEGEVIARTCATCKVIKNRVDFNLDKSRFGGIASSCKKCKAEYFLRFYKNNKDRVLEHGRKYRENNPIKTTERHFKYSQENREKISYRERMYRNSNIELSRIKLLRKRARRVALPNTLTVEQYESTLLRFNNSCALSGRKEDIHADHVIPISIGHGGTIHGNIIPLNSSINISKSNHNVFEWFDTNKERLKLTQSKFDAMIEYLAEVNGVSVADYRDHVYWCHDNPHDLLEDLDPSKVT